jgi:RNA polymerase sigma factor (sigma-70 family)
MVAKGLPGQIDESMLQNLLEESYPGLVRYIESKLPRDMRSSVSADDLIQETWIAAAANLPTYHHASTRGFYTWVQTIALRKLINAVEAHRAAKRGGRKRIFLAGGRDESLTDLFAKIAGPTPTPSSAHATEEALAAMKTALYRLPPDRSKAIRMRHLEHRSVGEISQEMSLSVHQVYRILRHAMLDLRRELGRASKYFSDVPRRSSGYAHE